jgi:hypothetical protein
MNGRPGILPAVMNALFDLGLTDAAEARQWLRGGGWEQFDAWVVAHRVEQADDEDQAG